MRRTAAILALMLASPALAGGITLSDAYARTAPSGAPTGAIYFTLHNGGDMADRLLGASTPVAAMAHLHTHIDDAGVMKMRRLQDGITVEPGASHALQRGGDHVMLMGVTDGMSHGTTFPLTLTFEGAGEVTITVTVDNERGQAAKP